MVISTSSSTHRCALPRSSSTLLDPSREAARSYPTRCPRSRPSRCARRSYVQGERSGAFAPGRVNLIGEHTDYNQGLALPFAIREGVTVRAQARAPAPGGEARIEAHASDLGESDEFALADPPATEGWRAFVRGVVAELSGAGFPLVGARLQISGGLPFGAGLSSSAALEIALCLALADLGSRAFPGEAKVVERTEIAKLCARVENDWVGAQTGLLEIGRAH